MKRLYLNFYGDYPRRRRKDVNKKSKTLEDITNGQRSEIDYETPPGGTVALPLLFKSPMDKRKKEKLKNFKFKESKKAKAFKRKKLHDLARSFWDKEPMSKEYMRSCIEKYKKEHGL